ncbi:hypothetical protein ACU19_03770 [Actinobaculum suis]|uniref:YceD family protein n=1 Tax=Actinobaculum suis TaxID=1657 RepID=UPI00066FC3CD|nr:YceD family protein [Actinobaculum suis]KMY23550.1 hypothetical protein ACU19_03770 [Actinobaculum suis]
MSTRDTYVISLVDLPRAEGSVIHHEETYPAPADMGLELIRVPAGSEMYVAVDLTSVADGVYIGGSVEVDIEGQCARCLRDISGHRTQKIADLAYYPERREKLIAEGDDDAEDHALVLNDAVNIESILRDAIVLNLPFKPLCEPDCAGLCSVCGIRLEELPADHHHELPPFQSAALDALEAQLRAQETGK